MEIYNKLFKFDKPVSTENECKIASDFTLDLVTSKSTERLVPFLCLIFIRHIIIYIMLCSTIIAPMPLRRFSVLKPEHNGCIMYTKRYTIRMWIAGHYSRLTSGK